MADHAEIRSLERIEEFLEQTKFFRNQLLKEVENLQVELRRLTDWIEGEALEYWKAQSVVAGRRYVEAQDALTRCMSYVREEERRPCTEEKKRVKVTKERRALCEEKLRTTRAAAAAWDRERTKTQAKIQRCRDLSESDMTVTMHHLQGQIETLQEYAGLRSPGSSKRSSSGSSPSSPTDGGSDETH